MTKTFSSHKFASLKSKSFNGDGKEDKKRRHTDGEKAAEKKKERDEKNATTIKPLFVQVEAVLYLGCNQISEQAYTRPQLFGQNVDFDSEELFFYHYQGKSAEDKVGEEGRIRLRNLPSNTRLCLQIIVIP